jgi:protein SCO1
MMEMDLWSRHLSNEGRNKWLGRALTCLLAGLGVMLALAACGAPVQLRGTDLGKVRAPDFSLSDQNGNSVGLNDLRGRAVVLTFLYTNCPDVCPLTAEHLRQTAALLGTAMTRVAFVAISVDPPNDTPQAIGTFVRQHGLDGKLIYLNGTREQLQPVWAAYYVAAQPDPLQLARVGHSTRVVLIDPSGRQRVNLDSDFDPQDLAFDIQALLNNQDIAIQN